MLRRNAVLGEGMLQDPSCRHEGGVGRCTLLRRAALSVALAGFAAGVGAQAVHAQSYGSDSGGAFDRIMQTIGLEKGPNSGINYTERPPLVVPPSRDLPPPVTDAAVPAPDWPADAAKRGKSSKDKAVAVVPDTAVQTPNPPVQKKPWYNPTGWFNKEEYAKFAGEPVRKYLTDPPAGYRVPSPEQPYGIGADKHPGKKQATSGDFNMGSAMPPSGDSGK